MGSGRFAIMMAAFSYGGFKELKPQQRLGILFRGRNMAREKFEDALEKLEDIVKKMEAGDMPLEDALKSFEEGIKLIRFCQTRLDEAERRVELLLGKEGSLQVKRFDGDESV
jgi:exodeoxyribonuclease VII small subunit